MQVHIEVRINLGMMGMLVTYLNYPLHSMQRNLPLVKPMACFHVHIMFIDDGTQKVWVYSTRAKLNVVSYMHILFVPFLLFEKKNYIEVLWKLSN